MKAAELPRVGQMSFDRLLRLFRENEATDFIASEFLLAPEIAQNVAPGSKFARALQNADISIRKEGFDWWDPPRELKQIIERTRREIESASSDREASRVLEVLMSEQAPEYINDVHVP